MKYNKGFAPILILVIALGVLSVGGVAYFAGKSSAPKNEVNDNSNYFPPVDQNYNPPTTNNNTSVTSNTNSNVTPPVIAKPSITIISPNGGEKFVPGDILSVSYTTSNIPKGTSCDSAMVGKYNGINVGQEMNGFVVSISGKQVVSTKILDGTLPANYKVMIDCGSVKDQSDSDFTITAKNPISDLKTYANVQYGFEFKYPTNGYKFSAGNSNNTFAFGSSEFSAGVSKNVLTDDPEYLPHFRFVVLTPSKPIGELTTYVSSLMNNSHGSPDEYVSSQYVNINGTQWLKVKSQNDFMGSNPGDYNYFYYFNNKLYWMNLWGASSADLEKIPSTFKFLPIT
ncbi:MAG: hypothetical protein US18_C0005G0019 [Parcubacteria group bacterium GW2011_GWB1_36_5]|nr:MAG: hypothetical protein US18_C0005G0019 [Parcubacteria group bacterium GW2011_GWB1_36_5]